MIEEVLSEKRKDWKYVCCLGYEAALEGRNSTFNPYKNHMSSTEYRLWDAGWEAGLREMVQTGLQGLNEYRLNRDALVEDDAADNLLDPLDECTNGDELKVLDERNGGSDAS